MYAGQVSEKLAALHGPLAGYKVALTHPKMQQSFGTQQPVWGGMYQLMLLPNQRTVEAAYGARPVYEATVGVRVKDAGINQPPRRRRCWRTSIRLRP